MTPTIAIAIGCLVGAIYGIVVTRQRRREDFEDLVASSTKCAVYGCKVLMLPDGIMGWGFTSDGPRIPLCDDHFHEFTAQRADAAEGDLRRYVALLRRRDEAHR